MDNKRKDKSQKRRPIYFIAFISLVLGLIIAFIFAPAVNVNETKDNVANACTYSTVEVSSMVEDITTINYYDIPLSSDLQDFTYSTADKYDIPAGLLFAIMDVESDFQIDAISETDDYGICQINKVNHNWLKDRLGLDDMLDPYQNITACAYIYSGLLKDNDGDINLAAMCYNCGSYGASKLWDKGIYETDYSIKIVNTYNEKYSH